MSHPHNDLRDHKVSERRLSMFGGMPHRAAGGSVSDERQDKALVKSMVKGASLKAEGGKVKARGDRACRAKGGRVKKSKGHTSVNVIVAPQGGGMPPGPPPGMAMKPPMPPGPPMAPGGPPPGGPPMMPHKAGGRAYKAGGRVKRAWGGAMPGAFGGFGGRAMPSMMGGAGGNMAPAAPTMGGAGGNMAPPQPAGGISMTAPSPMMNSGASAPMAGASMPMGMSRPFAKGGAVKSGNTWKEGVRDGTQVQHNDSGKTANQKDGQPSRKGMRVVTFWAGGAVARKTGGPVFSNGKAGAQMAPKLPAGSGGGEGRLAKRKLAYGRPAKEVNGAR